MEENIMNYEEFDNKPFDKYLLQINRIKLQDYIQYGLVLPDKYLGDECEKDIQSKNKSFLVVSDGYIQDLDKSQVLVELILTKEEITKITRVKNIAYFDFPLPITRIKKVYTYSKDIQKEIIANIKNSQSGFLPDRLFDIYNKNKKCLFMKKEYELFSSDLIPEDYNIKITYFDKRMGMFSFMKNTNAYYTNETKHISNYSYNYFSLLSSILKINDEEESYHGLDFLNEHTGFKKVLYSQKPIEKSFIESVLQDIEDEETKDIFSNLLKPTGTRDALMYLANKDIYLYCVALVYYFRQKSESNKIDNCKADISKFIPKDVAEIALMILGMYMGYKSLRESETIHIDNSEYTKIFGNNFNIKFELNSELDYKTIEAIYNISFGKKNDNELEYSIDTKYQKKIKLPSDKNFKNWYDTQILSYLDVKYITIKKRSFKEVVMGKYGDRIPLGKEYMISYIAKYHSGILRFDIKGGIYCNKNEFLDMLFKIEDIKKQNEFLEVCRMDKK